MSRKILLDDVAVDTTSAVFVSGGGSAIINVRATSFGGGVVQIEMASGLDVSSRFIVLIDGVFGIDSSVKIDNLPQGLQVRAVLTGSGGASNVFCDIVQ